MLVVKISQKNHPRMSKKRDLLYKFLSPVLEAEPCYCFVGLLWEDCEECSHLGARGAEDSILFSTMGAVASRTWVRELLETLETVNKISTWRQRGGGGGWGFVFLNKCELFLFTKKNITYANWLRARRKRQISCFKSNFFKIVHLDDFYYLRGKNVVVSQISL